MSDPAKPLSKAHQPSNTESETPENVASIKWWPLIVIFIVATILFFIVNAQFSITGRPTVDMLLGLGVVNLLVYIWIRMQSRWNSKTQFRIVGALFILQAILIGTVQMEGIYGNGRPIFAWRWKPLPADLISDENPDNAQAKSVPTFAEWPQFRGPNRDGIAPFAASNWSIDPPTEIWRKPIGAGWSSFVLAGDYCFTMEQRGQTECTVCYELETGNQVWVHQDAERFSEITGGEGPRSTPVLDSKLLYTLGATGILNCLDAANGDLLWTIDVLKQHESTNCYYGMCASPLVVDDKLIVNPGGKNASLVAYNKKNGDLVWSGGDAESSYASPQLAVLNNVKQILNFNAEGLYSHDLESGNILWEIPWISNPDERNNVCQPIQVAPNRVFLSSGYGRGSALFEFSLQGDDWSFQKIWRSMKLRSKFASAVFDGDFVYGLDEGILTCIDIKDGSRRWKNGRYGHGQMVKVGDYLVVQCEDGSIAQVIASPDRFEELARIDALSQRTWTHPVATDQFLLSRNDREIVCYRLRQSDR